MSNGRSAMSVGAGLAILAALSFGVTTPMVERAGRGLGPFTTAALLYIGACLSALLLRGLSSSSGAPLRKEHFGRLLAMAFLGACVAPSLFVWGLQQAGATTGSLLLNLEAAFTVVLAWVVYREPIGARVLGALAFMTLGGIALSFDEAASAKWSALGALATAGATAVWALDNILTRGLAEQDAVVVVAGKGALGASLTGLAALVLGESAPSSFAVVALLACGATGYGLSLRLYMLAQRHIGAARTGSIFALAPFIGAGLAWALGDRSLGGLTIVAALLFASGVFLHATERHRHQHVHQALTHDHVHRHDDGHHDHTHFPAVVGEHAHPHEHEYVEHDHEHAPDIHHGHPH